MNWIAKPTGDMTLSVVDTENNDFQILKIDMLSSNTMKAETGGELLAIALNDLNIIANFSKSDFDISRGNRMFEDGNISPLPWSVIYNEKNRKLTIKSRSKKIAERIFPVSTNSEYLNEIIETIIKGIDCINK